MASLLLGWIFVATLLGHMTFDTGMKCESPLLRTEFDAQTRFPITIRIENPSRRWPLLFLTSKLIISCGTEPLQSPPSFIGTLPPRSAGEFRWHITIRKRGESHLHGVETQCSFPGSMLVRKYFFALDVALLALPSRFRLSPKAAQLFKGQQHASGHKPSNPAAMEEFIGVREYRPGDNPRNVSLSHSVRMPDYPWQLVVREFEDPSDDEICMIVDTLVPPPDSTDHVLMLYRFERAISFSAALCRQLCEQKRVVRFIAAQTNTSGIDILIKHPSKDLPQLERQLARIQPMITGESKDQPVDRSLRSTGATVLRITLHETSSAPQGRQGAVIIVTPSWQNALVSEVLAN